jgi:predicted Fe-Mo cluster-binding NifX family protein
MNDLAKYGIDVSQISEEDYNKAITQLKMKLKKQYQFRQAYAQNKLTTVM